MVLKELEKESKKTVSKAEKEKELLLESKQILDQAVGEDLELLKEVNLDRRYKAIKTDITNLSNISNGKVDKHGRRVFSIEEIESVATKYRLRFLPTGYFMGNIGINTVSDIKKFKEDNPTYNNKDSFYILAPSSMFKLRKLEFDEDPLLFYLKNKYDYGDTYDNRESILVSSWGKEFNVWRKIRCLPLRSIGYHFLVMGFVYTLLFTLLGIITSAEGSSYLLWSLLFPIIATALHCVINYLFIGKANEDCTYSDDVWQNFKV